MRKTNFESFSRETTLIGLILGHLTSEAITVTTTGPIFLDAVEEC